MKVKGEGCSQKGLLFINYFFSLRLLYFLRRAKKQEVFGLAGSKNKVFFGKSFLFSTSREANSWTSIFGSSRLLTSRVPQVVGDMFGC